MDHLETKVVEESSTVRGVVDTAYHKLVICMFTWLNQLGGEQSDKYKYIVRFGE